MTRYMLVLAALTACHKEDTCMDTRTTAQAAWLVVADLEAKQMELEREAREASIHGMTKPYDEVLALAELEGDVGCALTNGIVLSTLGHDPLHAAREMRGTIVAAKKIATLRYVDDALRAKIMDKVAELERAAPAFEAALEANRGDKPSAALVAAAKVAATPCSDLFHLAGSVSPLDERAKALAEQEATAAKQRADAAVKRQREQADRVQSAVNLAKRIEVLRPHAEIEIPPDLAAGSGWWFTEATTDTTAANSACQD